MFYAPAAYSQTEHHVYTVQLVGSWLESTLDDLSDDAKKSARIVVENRQSMIASAVALLKSGDSPAMLQAVERRRLEKAKIYRAVEDQKAPLRKQMEPLRTWLAEHTRKMVFAARLENAGAEEKMRRMAAMIKGKLEIFERMKKRFGEIEMRGRSLEHDILRLDEESRLHRDRRAASASGLWQNKRLSRLSALRRTEFAQRDLAKKRYLKKHRSAVAFAEFFDAWDVQTRQSISGMDMGIASAKLAASPLITSDLNVAASAKLAIKPAKSGLMDGRSAGLIRLASLSKTRNAEHFRAVWLTMPAGGEVVGDALQKDGFRIVSDFEQPVVAPGSGRIIFADNFKNFGQLLIIDHGGDYHTLLSGLSTVRVQINDYVIAGQLVGLTPISIGNVSTLYVELRHQGQPVNPVSWTAQRQVKKVRG